MKPTGSQISAAGTFSVGSAVAIAKLYFHEKTWVELMRHLFTHEGIAVAAIAGTLAMAAIVIIRQPSYKSMAIFLASIFAVSHFASMGQGATADPPISNAGGIAGETALPRLRISFPLANSEVGRNIEILGTTSQPGWFNYASVKTPTGEVIQDVPLTASEKGSLSGSATIGDALAKDGEEYWIRIIATPSVIEGRDLMVPKDAISSEWIKVRRTRKLEER